MKKSHVPFGRIPELRQGKEAMLLATKAGRGALDDNIVMRYPSRLALETFLKKPGEWHALVKNKVQPNMLVYPAFEKSL